MDHLCRALHDPGNRSHKRFVEKGTMKTLPKAVNFAFVTAIAMALVYFLMWLAGVNP